MANPGSILKNSVWTCSPEDSVALASQIMWEGDCGVVPVTNPAGKILGIVTDRDICMTSFLGGNAPQDIPVGDAMTTKVVTCTMNASVREVLDLMGKEQVRRLPVVREDGVVVGIVSMNDLVLALERPRQDRPQGLTADALAKTLARICRHRAPEKVRSP
jgi:CBS domain-containing protein